ncbi:hypothetical protein [uncultured Methylobacterium sp.]|jgi:hypothetical protein|uniref:hypothetical protein n=1 Tax=uncultured Methylobacterium sp. TaxID=157278 RepID=UPI002614198C|nr:hypothetical protein [uncultured Methylobacterium sp.]
MEHRHEVIVSLPKDVHVLGSRDGLALARGTACRWSHIIIVVAPGRSKPSRDGFPEGTRLIGKILISEVGYEH